jgi:hypothetical protein
MEEAGNFAITLRNQRLQMLALIVCVLAANAVFVGQAFQMDDGIYLHLARNIAKSPLSPQDFPIYFEGLSGTDLASTEHALPVTAYYTALIAHLVHGLREADLHMGFLAFPLILACGMFALARCHTAHPLLASLTLVFLPSVYVLSHTLMTDVPQLALWVSSVAIFTHGIESRSTISVLAAAFTATLACFVSYASICLILLLAILAGFRKNNRALLSILILPCVVLGIWLVVSFSHYGRLPPTKLLVYYFAVKGVLSPVLLLQKSVYIILAIGGVTIFPFGLLLSSRKSLIVVALLLAAPAIWICSASHYAPAEKLIFTLFFCAGLVAIGEIISDFISGRETEIFLGAWFIGMLLFTAIFYMTGSARYLFAAMPPFVLLFYRRMERLWADKLIWICGVNLALGAALALALATTDYEFAGIYREFASTFQKIYSAGPHRVWFAGEWGLRAYLEGSGAEELGRRDARPRKGDLLAIPTLATPYPTLFDDGLPLDSIVLVAQSQLRFSISRLSGNPVLAFTVGMPLPEKSDGVNLRISFDAGDVQRTLYAEHITPATGAVWTTHQVPLSDMHGNGNIVFSSEVGGNDAIADWISIARARILTHTEHGDAVLYDFREHLADAAVERVSGVKYQTRDNIPIFPMTVWLRQEPATILRGTYKYRIPSPIRLLDARVHAGFWSMGWGVLPFSFNGQHSTVETIHVYEISRDVDSYGEKTPDWYTTP